MAELEDLYSETETIATCWVGGGDRVGKLVASSRHVDAQGTGLYYGSFAYDGETGTLTLGDLQLGLPGRIVVGRVSDSAQGILLDGVGGKATLGGRSAGNGTVTVVDRFGTAVGVLDAEDATITAGGGERAGKLVVNSVGEASQGQLFPWGSLVYDGDTGVLDLGDVQLGKPGKVVIGRVTDGEQAILLDGTGGHVTLGGRQAGDGSLTVKNHLGTSVGVLDAENATFTLGHVAGTKTPQDAAGNVVLRNADGASTVSLDGASGNVTLGGGGVDGDLTVRSGAGETAMQFDGDNATLTVGGVGVNGDIFLKNENDIETIKIYGSIGDIEFLNADLAEEFEVGGDEVDAATPGTVMVLAADGTLAPCGRAYDSKVVGVVAGAGDHRPGIVMDKSGGDNRVPIALVGKAFCLADASEAAIEVGDLLTTSPRSGHAMKATDRLLAVGSVIGKALSPLPAARGLIPVLVMAR
jgi:hypothetical protein